MVFFFSFTFLLSEWVCWGGGVALSSDIFEKLPFKQIWNSKAQIFNARSTSLPSLGDLEGKKQSSL